VLFTWVPIIFIKGGRELQKVFRGKGGILMPKDKIVKTGDKIFV